MELGIATSPVIRLETVNDPTLRDDGDYASEYRGDRGPGSGNGREHLSRDCHRIETGVPSLVDT